MIVGQKMAQLTGPVQKMGLLINGPSWSTSPDTSSSLSISLAMLAATWHISVTFNFIMNDGPGLGCTGLRLFYDGKKNIIDCVDL